MRHEQDLQASAMIHIPGGRFVMGSADFYSDEAPTHERVIAPFDLDYSPVTNDEFAAFVDATGYVTVAEQALDPANHPHLQPEYCVAGSVVFQPTAGPVDLSDWRQWWSWVPGANWRHPTGPSSDIGGLGSHPVVQVSYIDALAYADWVGKRLPTEAEFEFAAQAMADPSWPYAWGNDRDPQGTVMANTWRGDFPYRNTAADGWRSTSPVGTFPPNGYGLVDMIGNVWEWTTDYFTPNHRAVAKADDLSNGGQSTTNGPIAQPCCGPSTSRSQSDHVTPSTGVGATVPRRVLKGGSHLCAPEYCLRYRPAARSPQAEDTAAVHIGFRCARDVS